MPALTPTMEEKMEKAKFEPTPGRWSWNTDEDGISTVYSDNGHAVCDIWTDRRPDGRSYEAKAAERTANAMRISAAKVMYEALRAVDACHGAGAKDDEVRIPRAVWDEVRAAIRKAEGL